MSPVTIGYIGIGVLLILLFSRMQIGICMAVVGFLGFALIKEDIGPAFGLLKSVPLETFMQHNLSVIPLFLLMGAFATEAGLSEDLYEGLHKILGGLRGGLGMATVAACAAFAAICGSSVACAAAMAAVALPEMARYKYSPSLATGCLAAGGTIGILIPPSTVLIIYGIITEQSIGKLFLAGFLPGMLQALFYMATIGLLTLFNPSLGPRGESTNFQGKLVALSSTWQTIALFIAVIGGIYLGLFTPTEAAGFGAFGVFFLAIIKRKMTWGGFKKSLVGTIESSGMIFMILMGAMILGYFLSVSRIPFEVAAFTAQIPANRYVILTMILLLFLLLGCIMDSMAIVVLTVPIFFPVIQQLRFDPIWFGILATRVTELGLITPPVGLNAYVIKGISGYPMKTIFKGVVPFIVADVIHIMLLIIFPQISLLIPGLME